MEKPNTATVAYFDRALPEDPRAVRGQMFGHACAFVNGHMFFGTFAQSLVVRVGEDRAATLAATGLRVFEPMAGRAWREYVQLDVGELPEVEVQGLAREALDVAARLPPKVKKPAAKKSARKSG